MRQQQKALNLVCSLTVIFGASSEEFNDGFEVEYLVLAVDRVALSASVIEEFLALGGSDECHVFDS